MIAIGYSSGISIIGIEIENKINLRISKKSLLELNE